MKGRLLLFVLMLMVFGCKHPIDIYALDENSSNKVEVICEKLDSLPEFKFREQYQVVLALDALGSDGEMFAVKYYSKKLEHITLRDILMKSGDLSLEHLQVDQVE